MRFTDICKTYIDRADISLSHQMDFETYLRNHAQEIINLVEAAEQVITAPDDDADVKAYYKLANAIDALNKEQS
jgi:phosphate uptake regulator